MATEEKDNPAQGKVDFLASQTSSNNNQSTNPEDRPSDTQAQIKTPIEASPVQPDTPQAPVVPTPAPTEPVNLSRKERMAIKDKESLISDMKRAGVDLENQASSPLTSDTQNKMADYVASAYPKELAQGIHNIANTFTAPPQKKVNTLDQKALLDSEKRERRARFSDALTAFGEGLQGRTANPENFLSTRIERKRDKEFQDYKNATEQNANTKLLHENQNRKELINWADDKAKDMSLDARERAKYQQIADFHKEEQSNKDRSFKQTGDHYKAMENKKSGSGKLAKDQQNIKVSTDQKTYDLKPEEASLMYGEAIGNSDVQKLHPEWFDPIAETELKDDGSGDMKKTPTGKFTYKPKAGVDKTALIRAHLELTEKSKSGVAPQPQSNVAPQNSASYLDKYRKEKGLPTSGTPVNQTEKATKKIPSLFQ